MVGEISLLCARKGGYQEGNIITADNIETLAADEARFVNDAACAKGAIAREAEILDNYLAVHSYLSEGLWRVPTSLVGPGTVLTTRVFFDAHVIPSLDFKPRDRCALMHDVRDRYERFANEAKRQAKRDGMNAVILGSLYNYMKLRDDLCTIYLTPTATICKLIEVSLTPPASD